MKKVCLVLIVLICILSCKLNNKQIEELGWKYGEGFHIKDALFFGDSLTISNDTIFENLKPIAIIVDCNRRIDSSEILEIKSILTNEEGVYYAKFNNNSE